MNNGVVGENRWNVRQKEMLTWSKNLNLFTKTATSEMAWKRTKIKVYRGIYDNDLNTTEILIIDPFVCSLEQ